MGGDLQKRYGQAIFKFPMCHFGFSSMHMSLAHRPLVRKEVPSPLGAKPTFLAETQSVGTRWTSLLRSHAKRGNEVVVLCSLSNHGNEVMV